MLRPTLLATSSALAVLTLATGAFAQDATIYYSTPTIQSGQPVQAPPIVEAVPVYTPVPVVVPNPQNDPIYNPTTAAIPTTDDVDYLGTPQAQVSQYDQGVTFVSGGIGSFEKTWFDANGKDYKLKVTYADTTGHYLAGVNVTLADKAGNPVVSTITDGPYLLVNAKPGSYKLTSEYQGITNTKTVTIGKGLSRTSVTFKDM